MARPPRNTKRLQETQSYFSSASIKQPIWGVVTRLWCEHTCFCEINLCDVCSRWCIWGIWNWISGRTTWSLGRSKTPCALTAIRRMAAMRPNAKLAGASGRSDREIEKLHLVFNPVVVKETIWYTSILSDVLWISLLLSKMFLIFPYSLQILPKSPGAFIQRPTATRAATWWRRRAAGR